MRQQKSFKYRPLINQSSRLSQTRLNDNNHINSGRSTPLLARQLAAKKGILNEWWFDHCYNVSSRTTLFVITLMILGAADFVFRKVIATNMFNYRWFLSQMLAILTFLYTVIGICFRRNNKANKRTLSMKTFAWIGFLDMWHCNLLIVSLGILPGTLSAMVPQLIPSLTLGVNLLIGDVSTTSRRFKIATTIGTILIFTGIITALLTYAIQTPTSVTDESGHIKRAEVIVNGIMMILSCLPASISNVFKTSFLSKDEEDMMLFNCLVSFFQIIFGFIFAPLFIHLQYVNTGLHPDVPLDLGHLFVNFSDGIKCLLGENTHRYDECASSHSHVLLMLLIYIILIMILDYIMLLLVRRSEQPSIYHSPFVGSMLIAFIVFSFHASANQLIVSDLLRPMYEVHIGPIVGVIITALGMFIFSFYDPPLENEVNLWECMEDGIVPINDRGYTTGSRFGTFNHRK